MARMWKVGKKVFVNVEMGESDPLRIGRAVPVSYVDEGRVTALPVGQIVVTCDGPYGHSVRVFDRKTLQGIGAATGCEIL